LNVVEDERNIEIRPWILIPREKWCIMVCRSCRCNGGFLGGLTEFVDVPLSLTEIFRVENPLMRPPHSSLVSAAAGVDRKTRTSKMEPRAQSPQHNEFQMR